MSTTTIRTQNRIERAVRGFRAGTPVLVYDADGREEEVDMMYPAGSVEPSDVARLRNDAGGLICVAMTHDACTALDLPFLSNELSHSVVESGVLEYGDRSSFSLPVNHRDTRTGITDTDRSLTIRELGRTAADPRAVDFGATFRAPGHVPILKGAKDLLADRQGHTELGLALTKLSNAGHAAVVCEMLDDETGEALSEQDARAYAQDNGLPFLKGETLSDFVDIQ